MSKVTQYLNEHLVGTATSSGAIRERFATDGGVLSIEPEIVVFPRTTSDIRKVARFSWQLAEKGHVLSITARGVGTTTTGGSVGSGILLAISDQFSGVIDIAEKEKRIHAKAGTRVAVANEALRWHRLVLPGVTFDETGTIGGAIASASRSAGSGKYGTIGDAVEQLEVVLANGDSIETRRLSKKDVSKKKGEQTLEGEIYRQIDGLLDDNAELIGTLSSAKDSLGYAISEVKQKDGSIDLTPLFIGSQGTLGIISEAVIRADFYNSNESILVALVPTSELARDIADQAIQYDPKQLDIIDGAIYQAAKKRGKSYASVIGKDTEFASLLYVSFDDFSDRAREKKLKKLSKLLSKQDITYLTSDTVAADDLSSLRRVIDTSVVLSGADTALLPIAGGAHVPKERLEEFTAGVSEIADKLHVKLPLWYDIVDEIVHVRPELYLKRVSDKQKVFKLATLYAELVQQVGGTVAGAEAEGRLNAFAAYPYLDAAVLELYEHIRRIFDPLGTLNPGVKQKTDVKKLIRALREHYQADNIV